MTYAELKASRNTVEVEMRAASIELECFPRGPSGLTPDEVKFSAPYRAAKLRYQRAFETLRVINGRLTKDFAVELKADREAAARLRRPDPGPGMSFQADAEDARRYPNG